jgi:hypothetical protein
VRSSLRAGDSHSRDLKRFLRRASRAGEVLALQPHMFGGALFLAAGKVWADIQVHTRRFFGSRTRREEHIGVVCVDFLVQNKGVRLMRRRDWRVAMLLYPSSSTKPEEETGTCCGVAAVSISIWQYRQGKQRAMAHVPLEFGPSDMVALRS